MSIPRVFLPVKPGDFSLNVVTAHKRFTLNSDTVATTASGYFLWDAVYSDVPTPIGSQKASNDATNSVDNSYQNVIWKSIDARYYRFPYDMTSTLEHSNERFTFKHLGVSASILSLPYLDYGHSIKPGSVEVTNSLHDITLTDDENGNLYDQSIDTGSFTPRHNVVAYWGFNTEYRRYRKYYNNTNSFKDFGISYKSRTFTPDIQSTAKNVKIVDGIPINSTGSGHAVEFDGLSYILTPHRDEFNFSSIDDFSISFWFSGDFQSQNNTDYPYNTLLTKKGVIYKQEYGLVNTINNTHVIKDWAVSASYQDEEINVYPFNFIMYNDASSKPNRTIEFNRSDGINNTILSGSFLNNYNHICVTKSGSLMTMYINGSVSQTTTDRTLHPLNNHCVMFGAENRTFKSSFNGLMDEIRIYDVALNSNQVSTLANKTNQSLYQTAVVGNVFYKGGNVVVSAFDPKYKNTFKGDWVAKYRGSHDIYNYNCLIRIPAGSFNLSLNPTALQAPNSDLIINDMTGSLEDNALFPYATTIGLYNDSGELMVIGKLSQPLKMRPDIDQNINVQWDA